MQHKNVEEVVHILTQNNNSTYMYVFSYPLVMPDCLDQGSKLDANISSNLYLVGKLVL
jgi:hypothetical protein